MGELMKVFIAATGGVLLGAYVEPKITPHLPASIATAPATGKIVHAAIGGGSAVIIYWGIRKVA